MYAPVTDVIKYTDTIWRDFGRDDLPVGAIDFLRFSCTSQVLRHRLTICLKYSVND